MVMCSILGTRVSMRLLATGCIAFAFIQPAFAQDAGAPSAAKSSTDIGDIIVTARRTQESQQRVPIAITTFSQEALNQNRIESLSDLQQYIPSATTSGFQNANQQFFTLRGQGETGLATGGGAGGGPAVVGYLSEVPVPIAGPGLYYDLQSVEVLAGPQGTLFGRNTTGGAILFEPRRPSFDVDGYAQVTVGNYNRREFVGAFNVPIVNDKVALRVAGQLGRRDGYTNDVVSGRDYDNRNYNAARAELLVKPSDKVENYFIANYVDYREHGPGNVLLAVNPLLQPGLVPYLAIQQSRDVRHIQLSTHELNQGRFVNLINKTTFSLTDDITLKNIVSYSRQQTRRQDDEDGSPFVVVDSIGSQPGTWNIDLRTITEELQLHGKTLGGLLDWQVGGFYDDTKNPANQTFTQQFGTSFNNNYRSDLADRSKAIYGQVALDLKSIAPGLKFTAGWRHTWDWTYEGAALAGGASATPKAGDPCFTRLNATYPNCFISASAKHDGDGYTFGFDYQASRSTLLYVVTRQGYKSGGFNIIAAVLGDTGSPFFTYKPEKVRDLEGGIKTDWHLGGVHGRTNLAMYDSWYSDAQVLTAAVVAGSPQGLTANAASANIWGIELENIVKPTPSLELNLTYSYLDARYRNYVTPLGQDLTHTPYPYAPKNKLAIGARVRTPLPSAIGELWLGANYAYQSKVYVGIGSFGIGSPANTQAAYGLLNLRADWTHVLGSRLTLSAFVTNATNKVYQVTAEDFYNATGTSVAVFGEPRMFGGSVRYDF
jgi:iron complex outermembrane receptor protein